MNLEELLLNTKSKVVYLIDKEANIIDLYIQSEDLNEQENNKIVVFRSTISNMIDHFFSDFLKSKLNTIIIKSDKYNVALVKLEGMILCFLSEQNINLGLLGLSIRKEINNK